MIPVFSLVFVLQNIFVKKIIISITNLKNVYTLHIILIFRHIAQSQ